jgi:hypothetical protein
LTLVVLGCGRGEAEPTARVATTAATPADHLCPMAVPGAMARTVDVVGGVALELTTNATPVDVADLRRRVVTMAQRGSMGRMAGPSGGRGGRGARHASAPAQATQLRLEEVARGERVILLARDPKQIASLRAHARAHAARMGGGACEKPPAPPRPAPDDRTAEGEI